MLIEFSVQNFRSFKEKATLSLEASTDDWLEDECVTTVGGMRLLKSAAVFGANAGGKSNFLKAMAVFRNFIRNSSKETQQGEKIPVMPFRLHEDTESAPTVFEAIFLQNGARYRYGFGATTDQVETEWLFRQKDSTRETCLFTREGTEFKVSAEFREGKGLEERTRSNALFLSVTAQFNGAIAGEIFNWLNRFRNISGLDDADNNAATAKWLQNKDYAAQIKELMRQADVGIEDIRVVVNPLHREHFGHIGVSMIKDIRVVVNPLHPLQGEILSGKWPSSFSIKTYHQKFNTQQKSVGLVEFDLDADESAGTQKFLALAGPFLEALTTGSILFVDELEARLHPLLTRALVSQFNSYTNSRDGQLIFASHDDGLLDAKRIRRDQVWFVVKDDFGASRLYSLAEFKVRKDAKFGKEYLFGQFGGVPRIRNFQDIPVHAAK